MESKEQSGTKARTPMPRSQRAKQFAPFDALTGFGLALAAKRRQMGLVEKLFLSEEEQEKINEELLALCKGDRVGITYYAEGEYVKLVGRVEELSEVQQLLRVNETKINFADLADVKRLK